MSSKNKKYILFCTQFFRGLDRPGITGGLISNFHLARVLSLYYDVIILSFDEDLVELSALSGYCGKIIKKPMPRWRGFQLFMNHNNFILSKVREVIEEFGNPSVLISTGSTIFANSLFTDSDVKSVSLVRGPGIFGFFAPSNDLSENISNLKRDIVNRMQTPKGVKRSDLILVNSIFMEKMVRCRFKVSKVKKIYPPLDIPVKLSRKIDKMRRRVGFIDRISGKNLNLILKLGKCMPDVQFIVFGSKSNIPGVSSNIEFIEWESDREKMYSRADLWLVPSKWPEPFGRVSIEAQAMGCHVLVSNRGGLPETVPDKSLIVKSLNASDWEEKIRAFFYAPEKQMKSRPLIGDFLQRFSVEVFEREVKDIFDQLLMEDGM